MCLAVEELIKGTDLDGAVDEGEDQTAAMSATMKSRRRSRERSRGSMWHIRDKNDADQDGVLAKALPHALGAHGEGEVA